MKETLSLGRQEGFLASWCPRASYLRTWLSLSVHGWKKAELFNPWRETKGRGRLQALEGPMSSL